MKTPAFSPSRWAPALIFLATLAVFSPALSHDFVNWDDDVNLINNPEIRSLSPESLSRMAQSFRGHLYKPLVTLSFALEYQVAGLDPRIYHATNIVLHAANAVLVFAWLVLLGAGAAGASFGALIFSLHPLRVESVAWASQRKDVLFAFFYMASLLAYHRHQETKARSAYWVSIFFHLLSCLSKAVAMTLPFILFLEDWRRGRKIDRKAVAEKLPYFMISAAVTFLAVKAGAVKPVTSAPFQNILFSLHAVSFYLSKTLWPVDLSAFYLHPWNFTPFITVSIGLVAALAAASFVLKKKVPLLFFAMAFFAITIAPNIQLIPSVGDILYADRYSYLPSLGFSVLGAFGLSYFLKHRLKYRNIAVIVCAALLLELAATAYFRSYAWQNSIRLWTDVLAKHPRSKIALVNRSEAYFKTGFPEPALKDALAAVQVAPFDSQTHVNLANIYACSGFPEKSAAQLKIALEIDPENSAAENNLGLSLVESAPDEAIRHLRRSIELNPKNWRAHGLLAEIALTKKDFKEALKEVKAAYEIEPLNSLYLLAAKIAEESGDRAQALAFRKKAVEVDPRDPAARSAAGTKPVDFRKRKP